MVDLKLTKWIITLNVNGQISQKAEIIRLGNRLCKPNYSFKDKVLAFATDRGLRTNFENTSLLASF